MVKALRQWLDTHELPAIIAAVLGVVVALSVLMVVGGYLVASALSQLHAAHCPSFPCSGRGKNG